MNVAGIILAAGASRRLGQPKQDIRLGGDTLLQCAVRTSRDAGLDPVFAVVAPDRAHFPEGAIKIPNPEAAEGMASSIRVGILAATQAGVQGAVILACDQPAVTSKHLRLLLATSDQATKIVASAYAAHKGVPAFFPAAAFINLLQLTGDTGARDLMATARVVALANGELDIDTPEDLRRAKALFSVNAPRLT